MIKAKRTRNSVRYIREIQITEELQEELKDAVRQRSSNRDLLGHGGLAWNLLRTDERIVAPTWRHWLRDSKTTHEEKELVVSALTRMTIGDGPNRTIGYLGTMNELVTRVSDSLAEPALNIIDIIFKLERFGLTFNSSTELVRFASRFYQIALRCPKPFKDHDSRFGPRATALLSLNIILLMDQESTEELLKNGGDALFKKGISLPKPYDPEALLFAVDCFTSIPEIDSLWFQIHLGDEMFSAVQLWSIFAKARSAGFSDRLLIKMLRQQDTSWQLMALSLINANNLTPSDLSFCLQVPSFIGDVYMDPGLMERLKGEWERCGQPCSLKEFWKRGGTQQAWQQHMSDLESEAARAALVHQNATPAAPTPSTPKPDQTPKGTKRHQRNFQAPVDELKSVDFRAMCSELDVSACFPQLEEKLVRTVLVYGLLQVGNRLATSLTLPSRDERKLWSHVKDHVDQASRKQLSKALRPLVEAHLISFKRGRYQLASKNAHFPQANTLLTQLWGLVNKYTT